MFTLLYLLLEGALVLIAAVYFTAAADYEDGRRDDLIVSLF